MSKNLTRKGLALGAIVALGTSLFAGAPAFAGVESTGVTLVPAAGTTYNSIAGSSFDLATVVSSGIEIGSSVVASKLSYLITNSAAAPLSVKFQGSLASSAVGHTLRLGTAADTLGNTSADTVADSVSLTNKAILVTGITNNVGVNSSSTSKNHLIVTSSTDATENVVLTVQAFIDENSNGVIDSFDLTSPARTLTFIPAANVTATTTVTSSDIHASTIAGKVVLGNDINMANLGTDVKIGFKKNGSVQAVRALGSAGSGSNTGASVDVVDSSYDSTDVALKTGSVAIRTSLDATDYITGDVYLAQAYYRNARMVSASAAAVKLGTASATVAPVAGSITSIDGTDDLKVTAAANATVAGAVRSGYTGAVTFTSKVLAGSTVVKIAGAKVLVTVSKGSTFDSASTFTAGGKTLTATSGAVTFTTTSDADGVVSFTGSSNSGKKGDIVNVQVQALTATLGYATADTKAITYTDAILTNAVVTNVIGTNGELKIAKGGSFTLEYALTDQFGQAFTSARRVIAANVGGYASFSTPAVLSGGKASVTITDNSTTAGTVVVGTTLQKQDTDGNWITDSSVSFGNVTVNNGTAVTSAVSASASSSVAVATVAAALVTADLRVDGNTKTTTGITYGASATQTISGVATDATGAGVAGEKITISGAGVAFVAAGPVYTVGSATINATSTGSYSIAVYSATSGKKTITVTAGSATQTVTVEFTGISTLDTKGAITLDVSSLSQVGRSVTGTVTVLDSYGNPVNTASALIAVSVTGVGSVSTATLDTDATGKATFQFVAGANDFGDAVITAKYTNADDTVVSATKTVSVGITDAQVDVVNNRVTAVASFSKGKTVGFYVDGVKKWSKLSASDADVVLNYNLKKGRHTVTVKISGGFITSEVIVVK